MHFPSPFDVYRTIEQRLDARLQEAMDSEEFAQALGLVHTCASAVARAVGSVNDWALHAVNMPATSDITRLTRHVGELDREVRMLRHELSRGDGGPDAT